MKRRGFIKLLLLGAGGVLCDGVRELARRVPVWRAGHPSGYPGRVVPVDNRQVGRPGDWSG